MSKKIIFLSILLILQNFEVIGQYSNFKNQKINNSKGKKEVKKKDDIKTKTKNCTIYDGLFTIYQSKKRWEIIY